VSYQPLKRGAPLPYTVLAGVEPCRDGWLVVSAKLQRVSMYPEPPQLMATFAEVLDYRPAYAFIAVHCPIGLLSQAVPGGRRCDREARRVLGHRRGAAIVSPPTLAAVAAGTQDGLSAVTRALLPRIREVQRDVASYHQKLVYEVHPELGFYQLNGERPLRFSKRTPEGREERLAIVRQRIPGIDRSLENRPTGVTIPQLLDACADLWTARRIAARAIVRLPEDPEWNEDGMRMELVR